MDEKLGAVFLLVIVTTTVYADFASMVNLAVTMFNIEAKDLKINEICDVLENAEIILSNDVATGDEHLRYTLIELDGLTENLVMKIEFKPLPKKNLKSAIKDFLTLTETILKSIKQITGVSSNNTMSKSEAKIYINGTEGRVLRLLNVYVTNYNKEIEIQEGDIVAAAVKAKGKDISQMVTRYSQILDIPTDTQNTTDYYNKDVILYALTYKTNLYSYVENDNIINSGTGRTFVENTDGTYLELYANQDEILMVVDASDIFDDPSFWTNVTSLVSQDYVVINVSIQHKTDSALFNIKPISAQRCITMAFNHYDNVSISESNAQMLIETEGQSSVIRKYVDPALDIDVEFSHQLITLKIFPPPGGITMDAFDFHVQCTVCFGRADVIFALEVKKEISKKDFDEAKVLIKKLIAEIRQPHHVVNVAFMTFNTVHNWHIYFKDNVNVNTVINGISYTSLINGATETTTQTSNNPNMTTEGTTTQSSDTSTSQNAATQGTTTQSPETTAPVLDSSDMLNTLQALQAYMEINATTGGQKVIFVFTDGSYNTENVTQTRDEMNQLDIKLLSIGIGKSATTSGVNMIADKPRAYHAFKVYSLQDPKVEPYEPAKNITTKFCKGKWHEDPYYQYRFGVISAHMLNTTSNRWQRSPNVQMKAISAQNKEVVFKSNFLGTFGTNVFIIPPETIHFEEIFLNFEDKLTDSPYVLAVNIALLVLIVILSVILKIFDCKDAFMWKYTPLKDNPVNGRYEYYVSIHNGLWSSGTLSAAPYMILRGNKCDSKPRSLIGSDNKPLKRWTTVNFLLTTEEDLGSLYEIKVWHDNNGDCTEWYLEKILIADSHHQNKYTFFCERWLSQNKEDGRYYRKLPAIGIDSTKESFSFTSVTRFKLFDDYLWLSLVARPTFSRFTRVQRLFCISAMLSLSMLASAMWYSTDTGATTHGISVGPVHLNYKQIYVGVMSALISFPVGFLLSAIFRNRRFKDENVTFSVITTDGPAKLPWWIIFFGYLLAFSCIAAGAVFTFFYSLQWGGEKSQNWLISFVFGTTQGVILLDPVKVVILSLILVCVFKSHARSSVTDMAPHVDHGAMSQEFKKDEAGNPDENIEYPEWPGAKEQSGILMEEKRKALLDQKMFQSLRAIVIEILYLLLVGIICAHNVVTSSYWQNTMLLNAVKPKDMINSTDDFWDWLERRFTPNVFPKLFYNNDPRLIDGRKYMFDDISYRMGPARIRQKRVKGRCSVPSVLDSVISMCPPAYSSDVEEKNNYCPSWKPYTKSCVSKEFLYASPENTSALSYYGEITMYDGGGYAVLLNPEKQEVRNKIFYLQRHNWIDNQTRLICVEVVVFNINSKLFSLVSGFFEIPETGGFYTHLKIQTSRLYPYIGTFDYLVLGLQLIFVLLVFYRLLYTIYDFGKRKQKCLCSIEAWTKLLSSLVSIAAIGCYIARIDRTIAVIEELFNNEGRFVSFELVQLLDDAYKTCLSFEIFIAILNILKPLTFNYYLYLMQTSLLLTRRDLLSFILFLMIPLTAFASLFYLFIGKISAGFRSLQSSYLTLFRALLAMVKLRESFELGSVGNQVIFAIFVICMSIILVNYFICILNEGFSVVKSNGGNKMANVSAFDHELNTHFWRRVGEKLSIFEKLIGRKQNIYEKLPEQGKLIEDFMKLDNQFFRVFHLFSLSQERDSYFADTVEYLKPSDHGGILTKPTLVRHRK